MRPESRIYVAGHRGLAGSAIVRRLRAAGHTGILTRTHDELDLTDQRATSEFFEQTRPEYVFLAAAKVGGIVANDTYPADFIQQNLAIQTNVIHQSWRTGVKRLLFLGSSCIYPRDCPQPMKETHILTGPLESTNRPYAIAKIAGIEMCSAYNRQFGTQFLAAMPTNLYGPGDNYDLETSHVLPALIRKMLEAKRDAREEVVVWGTGSPRREFLHSDDMADACVYLMSLGDERFGKLMDRWPPLINVGYGSDLTIRETAELVASIAGFRGRLVFDSTRPDGTPRKLLDCTLLSEMGWRPKISLKDGIQRAMDEFLAGTRAHG